MFANPHGAPYDDPSFGYLLGGDPLERDDDYLRELLQEMEAGSDWTHLSVLTMSASEEGRKRHFHILLLVDAGLMASMGEKMQSFRITNAGHDFLALTRRNDAWEAAKAATRHLGGASVQMLYRAAEGYARQKLAEFGIPLA